MPLIGPVPDAKLPRVSTPDPRDPDSPDSSHEHSPPRSHSKRKRATIDYECTLSDISDVLLDIPGQQDALSPKRRKVVEVPLKAIRPPPLAFPKSLYDGYQHQMPVASERSVLQEIIAEIDKEQNESQDSDEDYFVDADLDDFVIYREHTARKGNRQKRLEESPLSNELVSLHEINEWGIRRFIFDGIISFGSEKRYVQRVPFETLSIGGYGEKDPPTKPPDIWIQSFEGKKSNVWYRLRKPAADYERYHESFIWMAELAKHVVDYLSSFQEVALHHFQGKFCQWLDEIYGPSDFLRQWTSRYNSKDFRSVVASQANFLFCQATQVDEALNEQPLWIEIHPRFLAAVPENYEKHTTADMFTDSKEGDKIVSRRKTTVTPYVYQCFQHLPWAKFLYCQAPLIDQSKPWIVPSASRRNRKSDLEKALGSVNVGDVVALSPDQMTTWKSTDAEWLGYVQNITVSSKGHRLDLIWLYRPSDTQCLRVAFPYTNELFLSDHCNCGDSPILSEEVIRKPEVAFFAGPDTEGAEFFVRQSYLESDGAWRTLRETDFICTCQKQELEAKYSYGDTLLVTIKKVLEPIVFIERERNSFGKNKVKVRRLYRRARDYGDVKAAPNELVLTNHIEVIAEAAVIRECQIRFYTKEEREQGRVPAPYNRQGTGDCYFITAEDLDEDKPGLRNSTAPHPFLIKEGWNPRSPAQVPMKGLDIFCGGGNFARGLEEGGAVEFQWAADWDNEATHTYRANLNSEKRNRTQLFRGSVNDYLTQAMQGRGGDTIAQHGQVEIIAAGSPCQGFSIANPLRGNDRALLNVSMIASVVAFIDFYRPKYALMENVKGITAGPDTENVLALVISALVSMGYQLRTFALDAWNFGSPQSRTRVFISIAAPGMTPLPEPPHTHSHPENVVSASLGKLANGLRASSRYTCETPFSYITAEQATLDLPPTDGRVACIPFPDHRMSQPLSTLNRVQLGCVPRFPGGCTFIGAAKEGYMPQAQLDAFDWSNAMRNHANARGWQRVRRGRLMPTVLTAPRPDDGVGGTCVHWDQERLLTIMEVRRGQGVPDEEVIVGLPREQWKITGNSVARPVALALGLSVRKAWLSNTGKDATVSVGCLRNRSLNGFESGSMQPALPETNGQATSIQKAVNSTLSHVIRTSPTPGSPLANDEHETPDESRRSIEEQGRYSNITSESITAHPRPLKKSGVESEGSDIAIPNRQTHLGDSTTRSTTTLANTFYRLVHSDNTAGDFSAAASKNATTSNSPNTSIVIEDTTVSEVTMTTTTTVLHHPYRFSPEL